MTYQQCVSRFRHTPTADGPFTTGVLINGQWADTQNDKTLIVRNPITEEAIGRVPAGTALEADRAVDAAARTMPGWAQLPAARRVGMVANAGKLLQAREQDFVQLASTEWGALPSVVLESVQQCHALLRDLCKRAVGTAWQEFDGRRAVVREPAGVVGVITPCEQPLTEVVGTVSAALLSGCTVVLKPSTLTPLTAFLVAELFQQAGLPPGVLNVVPGLGHVVGAALAAHPRIDLLAFSGSREIAAQVVRLTADNGKGLVLRGGSGTAVVLLDEARMAAAVDFAVDDCLRRWSKGASAPGRLLVPRRALEQAEELAWRRLRDRSTAQEPAAALPPLATRGQQVASLDLVESAVREGARAIVGGPPSPITQRGYFVPLTVLSGVDEAMAVAGYEKAGPILCVMGHDGPAHAVALADAAPHGGPRDVWASDDQAALIAAGHLHTDVVRVNGAPTYLDGVGPLPDSPFDLAAFCRVKAIDFSTTHRARSAVGHPAYLSEHPATPTTNGRSHP
ncbi:aldehyde dehydrogenase family protein [Streptomyces odonnellii]|uniref:aldehyde dehydrogenase family protein n=1 Tax=Streptomyces odonnellii TaxID=1417980 RepID=UPI000698F2FA|nr:aldehyde dehydrogenase family protein [Streptomyces odonnellii]